MIITPIDNKIVENTAGKYLERENPQPQIHPETNSTLNNKKSIDRKNKSNSPNAKLSIEKLIAVNRNIKVMNAGKNLNLNE
ncbi:MAG: hypothetical protein LBS43_03380 [Prevotellaceae bacterium]|nr:hypothetical protein [Prevotellaceae bacterium]